MLICCVTVCVVEALWEKHCRHYLPQDALLEQRGNLEMFSVFWKERGDLFCGTPLFLHENTHPDCWGFQLTGVLSSVCDIE